MEAWPTETLQHGRSKYGLKYHPIACPPVQALSKSPIVEINVNESKYILMILKVPVCFTDAVASSGSGQSQHD